MAHHRLNRFIKIYLIILIMALFCWVSSVFLAGSTLALAGNDNLSSLSFADHLFETKEYYRAITEYLRFIFLFPDDPMVKVARLKIAYSYQKGEQWQDAVNSFEALWRDYQDEEIGHEALFQSAETLWQQKNFQPAIARYKQFIEKYPDDNERVNTSLFRLGCIQLESHKWTEAINWFQQVKTVSKLFPQAQSLAQQTYGLSSIPLKNPNLAAGLSAALPGAGQVYAQRYRDGLTAFLVNGGFIWGGIEAIHEGHDVLGGILFFIELGWYAGNIYSAFNSTKKFNNQQIENRLTPLLDKCRLSLSAIPAGPDEDKYQIRLTILY